MAEDNTVIHFHIYSARLSAVSPLSFKRISNSLSQHFFISFLVDTSSSYMAGYLLVKAAGQQGIHWVVLATGTHFTVTLLLGSVLAIYTVDFDLRIASGPAISDRMG